MASIQTVRGPIAPEDLGPTLIHEHLIVDFIGAEQTGPHRWQQDEVIARMLPYLLEIKAQGITGFGDCAPMFLGRDPVLLRRLSELADMHIITNTGQYKEPHLPAYAFQLSAEELAATWIQEWREGIGDTGIRPGFIKIAVNPGPLLPIQRKIVRAAALTHLATGLTVASHTGHAVAAQESLDIAEEVGMPLDRYIVVHADGIPDLTDHQRLADRGAWLEYDGLGGRPLAEHLALVEAMLAYGAVDQMLLSHDAGWYHVGEPDGGSVRPFTYLMNEFVPALRARGIGQEVIDRLLIANPARALTVSS
jgi:phosphotriesterase-related protein